MEDRIQKAVKNHDNCFNCAQAVACAFEDLVDVDETSIFKMTEGFGLGMGGTEATCGAISGAIAVLGLKNSTAHLESPDSKASTYKLSRELVDKFKKKNQSIVCRELKGVDSGKVLRSCQGCIEDATNILEGILQKME